MKKYNKEYKLAKRLNISVPSDAAKLSFDSFIVGDFEISFDITRISGSLTGELCVQGGGTPAYVLKFASDGTILSCTNDFITKTDINESHSITVLYKTDVHRFDIYADGRLMQENCCCDNVDAITFDKCVSIYFDFSASDAGTEVLLENVKACAHGDIAPCGKKIILTDKTTIPDDTGQKNLLSDKIALHMRSGVYFHDGKKHMLDAVPYYCGSEFMVPLQFFETAMGMTAEFEDEVLLLNKISEQYEKKDSIYFCPLRAIVCNRLGKSIFFDDSAVHSGMVIISDLPFEAPEERNELQALNDFCFFFRPSPQRIAKDYDSSPLKGIHPRVIASKDDFERIKSECRTNERKANWLKQLLAYCDSIMHSPTLKYELRDGVRLLFVAADFQNYMLALALAYRLTGDKKYFDCAWKHIDAVANMPDWNPSHHIDVGVMAFGYAVAYDWFYDIMTDEQRALMERGAYNNCLWTVNRAVEDENTPYTSVLKQNNHNVYSNAGVMAVCIAFMDKYPEVCAKLAADVVRMLECFMDKFAPYGGYYEGPYYGETAIDYTVRLFASMYPTLGTLYGLDYAQGFNMAGEYMVYMQSDVGSFNFADSHFYLLPTSSLFWLYSHYNICGFKEALADTSYSPANDDTIAYALLWYDVKKEESNASVALDAYYQKDEIITMRDAYRKGQVFVGIKAGETDYAHSHLDAGSFVFDANGKRWAHDLGQDDYNLEYKYSKWDIFRRRAESHNTLLIDPDGSPGYIIGSNAPITLFKTFAGGAAAIADKTKLYAGKVTYAARGYWLTDGRKSLVIRDEADIKSRCDVYWLMYIDSDADIDGNRVILTDKNNPGNKLKIEFVSSHELTLGVEEAKPFPSSPDIPEQIVNAGYRRMFCKINASGKTSITAKLTPFGVKESDISAYDTDMKLWQLN